MLPKTYIQKNLRALDAKYQRSKTLMEPLFYAKLAIIELCGWIEISLDEIIEKHQDRLIKNSSYEKTISTIINDNYGFHEKKHLKKMLVQLIGYRGIEQLEKICSSSKISNLYRELNELTQKRNSLAHTYIKNQTIVIDAPQLTILRFEKIYDGLKELNDKLSNL